MKMVIDAIGRAFSYLIPKRVCRIFSSFIRHFHSGFISRRFKYFGRGTTLFLNCHLVGERFISLGRNVSIGRRTTLTAYKTKGNDPEIVIGDNTAIGGDCHITSINRIEIGSNVVFGEGITVTDNSHGNIALEEMHIHPFKRPLASKGPVVIGDYVWVGDKSTILPNVKVGRGSVVGSNSVVMKDVPEYSVVAGNPARVVKALI